MTKKSNQIERNSDFQSSSTPTDSPYEIPDDYLGPYSKWFDPRYIALLDAAEQRKEIDKLSLQTASSIPIESTKWIYTNWLAAGESTIIVGSPGSGKTALACSLAAGITKGVGYELFPGVNANGKGHVIIINNEDSLANTLIPRLQAAGANLAFVHFIDTKFRPANEPPFSFSSEQSINRLLGLSKQWSDNIGLLIIDPIYLAVDGDHGYNYKARQAYERLTMLAKRLQCAILGIAHAVRCPSGKEPLARVAGTPALKEVPRSIIYLSKIASGSTESGGTHVLVHAKNSLGKTENGYEYCLREVDIADLNADSITSNKGLKFIVTDEKFGSAEDILKEADRPKPIETKSKTALAEEFLQTTLKDGPKLFIDIEELAGNANIAGGTLRLAKSNLNIKTKKREGDGRSVWSLADETYEGILLESVANDGVA